MSRISMRRSLMAAMVGGAATLGAISGLRSRRERQIRRAQGLDASITINRDRRGVPHVIAGSWPDAHFGFGFAVAEDRLWQMDVTRRVAMGRLSEIVGPGGLESDRLMRLIGMPRVAHRMVALMSDDECIAAERFAAGVNHYIACTGRPVEFRALRYEPARWEPADSAAVFRLLGWMLSGSIDANLTADNLRKVIGADWAEVIYRGGFEDHEPMIRDHKRPASKGPMTSPRMSIFPEFGASNAWAVSAERSITGGALLANDPHLELRNPSIWCEIQIEAPGFHVAGATVPGIPAIVIGRTPSVAWGVTAGMTPQIFLYRETLQGGTHVENAGEWQPLSTHDEVIAVKDQADEILHIRYTPRGPLVSDLLPQPDDQPVSLHWAGMEEGHELGVLMHAATARDLDEVIPILRKFTTPPLNVVMADSQNNIGAASLGRMAIRNSPPGLLPVEDFPPTYVNPEELPLEVNPERGWVACANNRLVDSVHPHAIYGNWAPGFRYRRIVQVLESQPRHSPNGFRTLQLDLHCLHAADVAPHFADLLEGVAAPWAVDELRTWDYEMTTESRAALLFEALHHEWTKLALKHRLPEDLADRLITSGGALSVPVLFVDRVLRGELPAWMDDENRSRIAAQAWEQARAWITEQLGPDVEKWSWGALHQLTFRHPLGRVAGPHRRRVNVGPFPTPGSRYTVWPMVWDARRPFDVMAGPSMRYVTDMKRPEQSWFTNSLGQSGSPTSRHFRDQSDDLLNGYAHLLWPDNFPPRRKRIIHPSEK